MGIREILLILDPSDITTFKNLLGDGSNFGVKLVYEVQIEKRGIADALIIGEKFLNGSPSCLILGDNRFVIDWQQLFVHCKCHRIEPGSSTSCK